MKTKTAKPITFVAMILDSSGSMESIRNEAISHFNEQIDTLKKTSKGQTVKVTFTKFSDEVEMAFINKPLSTLKKISRKDYRPNGLTALNDAIGLTIEKIQETAKKDLDGKDNVSVLFVIVSDGAENASRKYGGREQIKLKSMITDLTATGKWNFTYLGANQNLQYVSQSYGIASGNMMAFEANTSGMLDASARTSKGTMDYMILRSVGATQVSNFYSPDDKDKDKND